MKVFSHLLLLTLFGIPVFAQNTSIDEFRSLQADAGKVVGEIGSRLRG
jgi:hypothetical protein